MNIKDQEIIRIAQIIGKWVGGGVESVIFNYYSHINHDKIQFDFICDDDSTNIPYKEIEALGGRVIIVPRYQKIFKYIKELKRIFKENNYKIVHSNLNTMSVFPLFAAFMAKVPIRISHAHTTSNKKEWKKNILKNILRPFSKIFATELFACSELAGRYQFGNKSYNKKKVTIINNAIDIEKFKFDDNIRKIKRKEFNIETDTLVLGHIGRFVEQKNHEFIIDIFNEFHKRDSNSILLLIGQGPKMEKIKQKVNDLGLDEAVKFLGQRDDVNELYQVFDLFLFPSLYEGLGMVLIEAQCSGLPCVVSSKVPQIVRINSEIVFVDLKDSITTWVNIIKDRINRNRKINIQNIKKSGYDIKEQASKLEKKYIYLIKGSL